MKNKSLFSKQKRTNLEGRVLFVEQARFGMGFLTMIQKTINNHPIKEIKAPLKEIRKGDT